MVHAKKERTTRRTFCQGLTGAALTGAFVDLKAMAGTNPKSKGEAVANGDHLAAACGTFCGACPAYLAKHSDDEQIKMKLQQKRASAPTRPPEGFPPSNWMDGLLCDGCLSGGVLAAHCQRCNIRLCALDKQKNSRCSECEELPCYRVTNLINMGRYLHRKEYLPNLKKMREMGIQKWVQYEKERWSCPKCGLPMRWYDTECVGCGAARSERVYSLEQRG